MLLSIPVWFDEHRGHEGSSSRGRIIHGPLSWYRAHVHTGGSRETILAEHGPRAEADVILLYDRLCQISAGQTSDRRGRIFDQFGKPATVATIAGIVHRNPAWVTKTLEIMEKHRWVEWVSPAEMAPNARTLRAPCAHTARTLHAPRRRCAPENREQRSSVKVKKETSPSPKKGAESTNGEAKKTTSPAGPAGKANTPQTQLAIQRLLAESGVSEVDFRGVVSRFAPIAIVRVGAERFRESHKRKPIRNAGGWWRVFLRKNGVEL